MRSFCRKIEHCGPLSTYLKLRDRWHGQQITPSIRATGARAPTTHDAIVAQKVNMPLNCPTPPGPQPRP